jgi:hypothetical protein
MPNFIYEEGSVWIFLFITCLIGGGGAWMTGRSVALSWSSPAMLVLYILLLGVGVRFVHHALYDGTFFSLHYYIVDTIVVGLIGALAHRLTRARQMVTQYSWLFERSGPLGWRPRRDAAGQ